MMVNEKETSELTYESQLDEGFLSPNSTIDTYNKIKPVPIPDKVTGIDTTNYFLDQVIEADKENKLDTASINSLTSVSRSRATLYDMIIKPSLDLFYDDTLIEMETRIFRKEMDSIKLLMKSIGLTAMDFM